MNTKENPTQNQAKKNHPINKKNEKKALKLFISI